MGGRDGLKTESVVDTILAQLDTPILSIDYSLAPEAPYPRACQEVFYSYVWMLANLETLGTTGDTDHHHHNHLHYNYDLSLSLC